MSSLDTPQHEISLIHSIPTDTEKIKILPVFEGYRELHTHATSKLIAHGPGAHLLWKKGEERSSQQPSKIQS